MCIFCNMLSHTDYFSELNEKEFWCKKSCHHIINMLNENFLFFAFSEYENWYYFYICIHNCVIVMK